MERKQLLFFSLSNSPKFSERGVIRYIIEEFKNHFDKVHIICLGTSNGDFIIEKENAIFYGCSFWNWKKVIKKIDLKKIKFIYISDWFVGGFIGSIVAKKKKIPLVMRCGSTWKYHLDSPTKIIKSIIKTITKPIVINRCQKIAYNSKSIISKWPSHKHKVIYNPIDTEMFKPQSHKINEQDWLKVLFVGRICSEKGINFLSKAFEELDGNNVELGIIGSGDIPNYLKNSENVNIYGEVNHKEIPRYINNYDCLILPSLTRSAESFPNAILEAMACEKPIIATKVWGIPEIITNKENGILINEKSSKDIFDAIINLKNLKENEPTKFLNIGLENRKKVISMCNKKRQLKKLMEYLFIEK